MGLDCGDIAVTVVTKTQVSCEPKLLRQTEFPHLHMITDMV